MVHPVFLAAAGIGCRTGLFVRPGLVQSHELLERESLAGILLNALHDGFSTDGVVVRYVVVHAAVGFRSEHTAAEPESSFEHIYLAAVTCVVKEVFLRHFVHLARERQVFAPSKGFLRFKRLYIMSIDKAIIVDVFIAQLTKGVSTGLVLQYSSRIERIG